VSDTGPRARLEEIWRAALKAVDPAAAVRRAIAVAADGSLEIARQPVAAGSRLVVLAVGKAAAPMAQALEMLAGDRIRRGLAITPDGHGLPLRRIRAREASHPVPDARGERAAREAKTLVACAAAEDVLVVLLSGGASSLLPAPAAGLDLTDLSRTTAALLAAGAAIDELNAVRKHLSAVAGGRLGVAAACRRIEVLLISDVPGDRIDLIGSGPFAPDPTSYADALDAVARCGALEAVAPAARAHLEAGVRGAHPETPKPGDAALARVRHTLLAGNRTALEAAVAAAESLGMRAVRAEALAGEAREAGRRLAQRALASAASSRTCLVAGGETVVTVRGSGRGGRSQELALGAALALEGTRGVALLAAGTDGRDGPTDAAGAFVDGQTVARGRARGVDAHAALDDNDCYGFFDVEGGLLRTGPTRTNVMDLALVEVAARA
jgi:glycerate-2-kinase